MALLAAVQIIISNSETTTVDTPEVVASESPTAQPSEPTEASPTPVTTTPTTVRDTYSSGTGVSVSVSAVRGNSWLFVSDSNGTTLYSGQVRNGQTLNFSATTRISMRAGNAGAVDVSVNGKAAQQIGSEGQVVSLTYGVTS